MTLIVAALDATPAAAEVPAYEGLQAEIDRNARAAMSAGELVRAFGLFRQLLHLDPDDPRALREAGRCAQALGDLAYAERALARAHELRPAEADPELHYLRGQALLALERSEEARRELALAERQLSRAPLDRMRSLWMARIRALRGDLRGAEALLVPLLPSDVDSAEYVEIAMARADAHLLVRDWTGAERLVRGFLDEHPDHVQAREMLAWVLEIRGAIDEELALRADLAAEPGPGRGARIVRHARALERGNDAMGAHARYREASALGETNLAADVARSGHRSSPELATGLALADDPSGSTQRWLTGATVPLDWRLRLAVTGVHERGDASADFARSAVTGSAILTGRTGGQVSMGATAYHDHDRGDAGAGALLRLRTPPARRLQLHLAGELAAPWSESALAIREGGTFDAITASLYATAFSDRVVLSLAGRARRLHLAEMDEAAPHADQVLAIGGVDAVLWVDPTRVARGEIVDDDMLWPNALASAVVVSYRHYDQLSDEGLAPRIVLGERSQIDEISAVARHAVEDGRVSVELRGATGNDWARNVRQWRAGGSLLVSPTPGSRVTLGYDVATERATALTGRRHTGWITLHLDL